MRTYLGPGDPFPRKRKNTACAAKLDRAPELRLRPAPRRTIGARSAHLRTTAALVGVAAAALARSVSAGEDGAADPSCRETHSLWSPLPDRCLGVIDTDRPHQT